MTPPLDSLLGVGDNEGRPARPGDATWHQTKRQIRSFEALAGSPHSRIYVEVGELLDLYRRIAALRIQNAELSVARLSAPGDASGRAQGAASLPLADVFAARTPIDTRIRSAFESMGIILLGEVAVLEPDDLRARRNFGKRCLARVEEVLAAHGLKLRGR